MKEGTRYCKNNNCRAIDMCQGNCENEAYSVRIMISMLRVSGQTYPLLACVQPYPLSPYILRYF